MSLALIDTPLHQSVTLSTVEIYCVALSQIVSLVLQFQLLTFNLFYASLTFQHRKEVSICGRMVMILLVLCFIVRITLYERPFPFSINLVPVKLINKHKLNLNCCIKITSAWNLKPVWYQRGRASSLCCRNLLSIQWDNMLDTEYRVRRNYVAWPVFFSIQRQMKEDHDVISEDDQVTLRGSYQLQASFISAHIDWQIMLPVQCIRYSNLL